MSPVPEYGGGHRIASPLAAASNSAPLLHQNNKVPPSRGTRLSTLRDSMDSEEGSTGFSHQSGVGKKYLKKL